MVRQQGRGDDVVVAECEEAGGHYSVSPQTEPRIALLYNDVCLGILDSNASRHRNLIQLIVNHYKRATRAQKQRRQGERSRRRCICGLTLIVDRTNSSTEVLTRGMRHARPQTIASFGHCPAHLATFHPPPQSSRTDGPVKTAFASSKSGNETARCRQQVARRRACGAGDSPIVLDRIRSL